MKALTIWQPWASLIACGAKKYETRGWPTKYRGPIAIHAAMKDPCKLPLIDKPELEKYTLQEIEAGRCPEWCDMPTGAIIATADLVDVWHIVYDHGTNVDKAKHIHISHAPYFGDYFVPTEQEMALGDWTPGRYAWELQNVRILPEPIPAKGKQGLWNWEP